MQVTCIWQVRLYATVAISATLPSVDWKTLKLGRKHFLTNQFVKNRGSFKHSVNYRSALGKAYVPPTKVFRQVAVKWQLSFVSKRGSN